MKNNCHLADWTGFSGSSVTAIDRQVLHVRSTTCITVMSTKTQGSMRVAMAKTLQYPVHYKEAYNCHGCREPFPDDTGVTMIHVESVWEEVDEGITHQGSHGKRHEQLESGLLMRPLQKRNDSNRQEANN